MLNFIGLLFRNIVSVSVFLTNIVSISDSFQICGIAEAYPMPKDAYNRSNNANPTATILHFDMKNVIVKEAFVRSTCLCFVCHGSQRFTETSFIRLVSTNCCNKFVSTVNLGFPQI